jgi:hypothetical protein
MDRPAVVRRVSRHPAMRPLAAIWLVLVAGQAARLAATGSLLSGDDVFHFAHLLSLVVDRDLDARNEVRHFQHDARSSYTGRAKIGAHPRWGWPQARWGLGHTFGNRRLVNCTVVLAVGLAAILTALRPHRALRRAALVLGCVLVGLNVVAMWLWSTGPVGPLAGC